MLQHDRAAGALLPEYHRATPECPHPERWSMIDSMTAEVEVLGVSRHIGHDDQAGAGCGDGLFSGSVYGVDRAWSGSEWLRPRD